MRKASEQMKSGIYAYCGTLHAAKHGQTRIRRTVFVLHALNCENAEVWTFTQELVVAFLAQDLRGLFGAVPGISRPNHVLFWWKVS